MVLSKLVCPEFWIKILDETRVSRNELLGDLSFLIELLQFDFVFSKPCDTLDTILDSVIRKFELEGIILVEMVFKKTHIVSTWLITVLSYVINLYFLVT